MLEVEIKASLAGISPEELDVRRRELGFVPGGHLRQIDTYFSGEGRDLRCSGEALRIRTCTSLLDGETRSCLTYKGPKLDPVANTRVEHEIEVSDGETARELLESLGYRPLFTVDKVRREYGLHDVTLCLDEVEGLGRFLELEALVPEGDPREPAQERLMALLDILGVPRDRLTRVSYLEMAFLEAGK